MTNFETQYLKYEQRQHSKRAINSVLLETIDGQLFQEVPFRLIRSILNVNYMEILDQEAKAWVGFLYSRYADLRWNLGDMTTATMVDGDSIFTNVVGKLILKWNKNTDGLYEVEAYVI